MTAEDVFGGGLDVGGKMESPTEQLFLISLSIKVFFVCVTSKLFPRALSWISLGNGNTQVV